MAEEAVGTDGVKADVKEDGNVSGIVAVVAVDDDQLKSVRCLCVCVCVGGRMSFHVIGNCRLLWTRFQREISQS